MKPIWLPILFYGSVNTAEYLRLIRRDWVPLIWLDQDAFSAILGDNGGKT
jgi:hypothetical protein